MLYMAIFITNSVSWHTWNQGISSKSKLSCIITFSDINEKSFAILQLLYDGNERNEPSRYVTFLIIKTLSEFSMNFLIFIYAQNH